MGAAWRTWEQAAGLCFGLGALLRLFSGPIEVWRVPDLCPRTRSVAFAPECLSGPQGARTSATPSDPGPWGVGGGMRPKHQCLRVGTPVPAVPAGALRGVVTVQAPGSWCGLGPACPSVEQTRGQDVSGQGSVRSYRGLGGTQGARCGGWTWPEHRGRPGGLGSAPSTLPWPRAHVSGEGSPSPGVPVGSHKASDGGTIQSRAYRPGGSQELPAPTAPAAPCLLFAEGCSRPDSGQAHAGRLTGPPRPVPGKAPARVGAALPTRDGWPLPVTLRATEAVSHLQAGARGAAGWPPAPTAWTQRCSPRRLDRAGREDPAELALVRDSVREQVARQRPGRFARTQQSGCRLTIVEQMPYGHQVLRTKQLLNRREPGSEVTCAGEGHGAQVCAVSACGGRGWGGLDGPLAEALSGAGGPPPAAQPEPGTSRAGSAGAPSKGVTPGAPLGLPGTGLGCGPTQVTHLRRDGSSRQHP